MLAAWQVERIRQLHDEGYSQREIARRTGHSRQLVADVIHDRHYSAQRPAARPNEQAPQRCPTCGAKVTLPCLACAINGAASEPRLQEVDQA